MPATTPPLVIYVDKVVSKWKFRHTKAVLKSTFRFYFSCRHPDFYHTYLKLGWHIYGKVDWPTLWKRRIAVKFCPREKNEILIFSRGNSKIFPSPLLLLKHRESTVRKISCMRYEKHLQKDSCCSCFRDMGSNFVTSLDGRLFEGLHKMHDLMLPNNFIVNVPNDAFEGLTQLQVLLVMIRCYLLKLVILVHVVWGFNVATLSSH